MQTSWLEDHSHVIVVLDLLTVSLVSYAVVRTCIPIVSFILSYACFSSASLSGEGAKGLERLRWAVVQHSNKNIRIILAVSTQSLQPKKHAVPLSFDIFQSKSMPARIYMCSIPWWNPSAGLFLFMLPIHPVCNEVRSAEASPWNCLHHASLDSFGFCKPKEGHFWWSTIYSIICNVCSASPWQVLVLPLQVSFFFLHTCRTGPRSLMRQNCYIRACATYQLWAKKCQRRCMTIPFSIIFSIAVMLWSTGKDITKFTQLTPLLRSFLTDRLWSTGWTTKCFGFAGKRVWRHSKAQKGGSWVTGPQHFHMWGDWVGKWVHKCQKVSKSLFAFCHQFSLASQYRLISVRISSLPLMQYLFLVFALSVFGS